MRSGKIASLTLKSLLFGGLAGAVVFVATNQQQQVRAQASANPPKLLSRQMMVAGPVSFADIVEKVSPAVVSVITDREQSLSEIQFDSNRLVPEELYRFFENLPGGRRFDFSDRLRGDDDQERRSTVKVQGSGFIIDRSGHIVTNNHVIEDARKVEVRDYNGVIHAAEVVGSDPSSDLAVLKVDFETSRPFVEFAPAHSLRVGDWVVAIGNPFGLGGTVTAGIVSAIGRNNQFGGTIGNDYIQIDAPINRGNSGGPTFDLNGRVVGVNTAIYSPTNASAGIGFAISAERASGIVRQLVDNGEVVRGWLGVSIQNVTTEIAAALGLDKDGGAIVGDVLEGTPAERYGVESGDIIVEVDGKQIKDAAALTREIERKRPQEKVRLKVLRNGRSRDVRVVLDKRDTSETRVSASARSSGDADNNAERIVGLRVRALDEDLRRQMRLDGEVEGIVVTGVEGNSAAQEAGLRRGDIILSINGNQLRQVEDFNDDVKKAKNAGKEAVLAHVMREGQKRFVAISLQ